MNHGILVINCGSSSIKFSLADPGAGRHVLSGQAESLGTPDCRLRWKGAAEDETSLPDADHRAALLRIVDLLRDNGLDCAGVGHRVVHGGEHFSGSCRVDGDSLEALRGHRHLAPLHNPVNLLGIEAAREAFPEVPQVMVFDTSFHQTMPERAYLYALPHGLYEDHGVRRYGFHGTSHRYVAEQAARRLNRPLEDLALVTAHLGNGCSATAVLGGESVDTTMGMTPLEGLAMGTRSGDVDPSLHKFLCDRLDLSIGDVSDLLNKKSGLLGLSGRTHDMRELLKAEGDGDRRAGLAVEVFCYRLAKAVAGLVVAMGRLDALVFTGGIGENSAPVRERTLALLPFLGLEINSSANADHGASTGGVVSRSLQPRALVVNTDEEMVIARDTAALLP